MSKLPYTSMFEVMSNGEASVILRISVS